MLAHRPRTRTRSRGITATSSSDSFGIGSSTENSFELDRRVDRPVAVHARTQEHARLTVAVQDAALVLGDRDLGEPLGRQHRAHLRQRAEDERVGRRSAARSGACPRRGAGPGRARAPGGRCGTRPPARSTSHGCACRSTWETSIVPVPPACGQRVVRCDCPRVRDMRARKRKKGVERTGPRPYAETLQPRCLPIQAAVRERLRHDLRLGACSRSRVACRACQRAPKRWLTAEQAPADRPVRDLSSHRGGAMRCRSPALSRPVCETVSAVDWAVTPCPVLYH